MVDVFQTTFVNENYLINNQISARFVSRVPSGNKA